MFKHQLTIRVRYGETDQMGFVYYGNYALYFEVARVEALRSIGISYKQMEDFGVLMPVVQLVCNYKAPALYDQLLQIETSIAEMPSTKIRFEYQIKQNGTGKLLHTGETTLVFVDQKTMRPIRAPEMIKMALEHYFQK